jgi:hypothetical protein
MDLKKPYRIGSTLNEIISSHCLRALRLGKDERIAILHPMAAGPGPPMFDSYWSKNAFNALADSLHSSPFTSGVPQARVHHAREALRHREVECFRLSMSASPYQESHDDDS